LAPENYLQHIDYAAATKLDFTPLFADPKVFRPLVLDLCRPLSCGEHQQGRVP
jgi:hypothetical protein